MKTAINFVIFLPIHFNISLPSISRSTPIPLKTSNRHSPRQHYLTLTPTPIWKMFITCHLLPTYLTAGPAESVLCKMLDSLQFTTALSPLTEQHSLKLPVQQTYYFMSPSQLVQQSPKPHSVTLKTETACLPKNSKTNISYAVVTPPPNFNHKVNQFSWCDLVKV